MHALPCWPRRTLWPALTLLAVSVTAVLVAVSQLSAEAAVAHRLAGETRIETATAIAREAFPSGSARVYLARADVFADALAAGSLDDGPVLLVPSCDPVPAAVDTAIGELRPDRVVALGGPAAVCDRVLSEAARGRPTDRLSGPSRYETAVAIARARFPRGAAEVYLARAEDSPDAVAGGVLTKGPVLLVPTDGEVPPAVTDEVTRLAPSRVVALGGTKAVSDHVLATVAGGRPTLRLAGPSRVETAVAVSRYQFESAESAYLARGDVFADAVAAGSLQDGPVLLTASCGGLHGAIGSELQRLGPARVVALGGRTAVCDELVDQAVSASDSSRTSPRDPSRNTSGGRMFSGVERVSGGFQVPAGQVWQFDPNASTTVEVDANVVVRGTLRMRPARPEVIHTLRFVDIDESEVAGGGMQIVASDVGLWVTGEGVLDAVGSPKAGWNRTGSHPTWRSGDEIRVAPNAVGEYTSFARFTPGSPVPRVTHGGVSYPTEVFNLTRNVRIEGSPTGRAHIMFLHVMRPQTIRYVAIRHMGPKAGQVGRYGLHFHHAGDGTRGTLVEGVVVRDTGNHAFVPHGSHGITFRDTIAYNTQDAAYWWDPDTRDTYPANASFDVTYEHAAAFLVNPRADERASLTGFYLGQGKGNSCVNCVAVGVQGGQPANGFHWPSRANLQPNVWTFRDGVAHNNRHNGVYVWQNGASGEHHPIDGLVSYRNGGSGVEHGAYSNSYHYDRLAVFANGSEAVAQHANGRGPSGIAYTGRFDAAGNGPVIRILRSAIGDTSHPSLWKDMTWSNAAGDPIVVNNRHDIEDAPGSYDFVRVSYSGRDLEPADFTFVSVEPGSIFRVQRRDGSAYQIDDAGNVRSIPPFHP